MRDIIENFEAAAESAYEDMLQPNGMLKCGCGKLFKEYDGTVVSPNSYAATVCGYCFEEFMKEAEIQN